MSSIYAQGESGYADIDEAQTSLLLKVLGATAPYTGDEFFQSLTMAIATNCGVRCAYVAELLLDANRARGVAVTFDNEQKPQVEFDLAGTPCLVSLTEGSAVYSEGVALKFPTYAWLAEVGAEAYVGSVVCTSSGDQIGLIGIVHDEPLMNATALAAFLKALAPRVGAELARRQRESSLRRSEARLRLLAECSKDILFYYQMLPTPGFEYISPAVQEITGYPPEAFQANPETALHMLDEADRPRVRRAIATGSEEPIEARLVGRADGSSRWIEYRNFALKDTAGQIRAVGGAIRDITNRVHSTEALQISEQYRRALLSAIPDTLFRLDAEGTMLDYVAGETAKELPAAAAELVGRNLKDLLPAHFVTPITRVTQAALRTGKLQRTEFEVPSGNHHTVIYEARCLPFGKSEVLLILRDFTAIKWHEGEEERRRFRDELDSKVERLRTNPYGLTYRELAILHLVAEGDADKQIAESLGISIYTVNKHVGNILGKMNAASRTEAGVRAIREGLVG